MNQPTETIQSDLGAAETNQLEMTPYIKEELKWTILNNRHKKGLGEIDLEDDKKPSFHSVSLLQWLVLLYQAKTGCLSMQSIVSIQTGLKYLTNWKSTPHFFWNDINIFSNIKSCRYMDLNLGR